MKKNLKIKLACILLTGIICLQQSSFGQAENIYFDGETMGKKGAFDKQADRFVSTGGVKKSCGSTQSFYAYVMPANLGGGLPLPTIYIGDSVNDYVGTDIKTIEENKYYVVGYTTKAQTFPGVYDPSNGSVYKYYNAFIAYVNVTNPADHWIKVFGDTATNDMALAVSIDADDNAWVTGITNERAPCKDGSTQHCNPDCYNTGELLFAAYDRNGNALKNEKITLNGSTWSKGSDVFCAYNKVYVGITLSNSSCNTGYFTTAATLSFDLLSSNYVYKYLTDTANITASGLYPDHIGGMMLVGDIPERGNGYLWQFDAALNMVTFNEFDNDQSTWNFKAIASDSLCSVTDTGGGYDTTYQRVLVISGDDNTDSSSLSNMFALIIDPATLNSVFPNSAMYSKYVYNFSKNANIVPLTRSCTDVTQNIDYGVFGESHDNHYLSKTAYIVSINSGLVSGCEVDDSFTYFQIFPQEEFDSLIIDSISVLDSLYEQDSGMNWQNICEIVLAPRMDDSENKDSDDASVVDLSKASTGLALYPNPTNDNITIVNIGTFNNARFNITEASGKVVKKANIRNNTNRMEINTSGLSEGVYYITVWNNGKMVTTMKMVKQ